MTSLRDISLGGIHIRQVQKQLGYVGMEQNAIYNSKTLCDTVKDYSGSAFN